MDEKLGTELVSKNALSLINDNECTTNIIFMTKIVGIYQKSFGISL